MVNEGHAIVLSDRRLIANGRLLDTEATKIATIVGLDGSPELPVAHVWRLSNYEGERFDIREPRAAGEFVLAAVRQTEPRAVVAYPSGFDAAFTEEEQKALVGLLRERRPPAAIVGKAVEVMRRIAGDPSSLGWIGTDYTSANLAADPAQAVTAEFHTGAPTNSAYEPSMVDLVNGILIADPTVTQVSAGPWLVPKTGRTQPCPCGSGLKYKRCHGR